ncbi:MAG: diutan polysaccharide export protein [Ralstonia sp.]|uniref:CpsD/CapB family tyrosine-protein kinase n=1 Tax=Ralstonia sp. TaxID=54061 RepID=UPI00257D034E|nr:CpsD/CapB family tyrosine-protein kinase [Ralstonia sp.]MBA4233728.1 diutan polysaccharide export protein [Ralstonia sp.]
MTDNQALAAVDGTATAQHVQVLEPARFDLNPAIMVESDPLGGAAESIHALRIHLIARHLQQGRRGLVLAETGQAGSTFVAANLALSFAQAGVRTLLIDTDLRGPRLHEYITPSRDLRGLADIIDRPEFPIPSAINQVVANLWVMYAGRVGGRAHELLSSSRFSTICDLCLREFDITIATCPPANYFSDVRRVASLMRDVIIIARRDVSFIKDLKTMADELTSDGARVLGTVYNDF